MKKKSAEIISLNEELISFESSDIGVEALEQRLEMVLLSSFRCLGFTCRDFTGCGSFTCTVFND